MTTVKTISTFTTSTPISGACFQTKERFLSQDRERKELVMIINYTSLEAIRRSQAIFTKICSTMTYRSKSGLMLGRSNRERCRVRGPTILWSSGMEGSLSMEAMMAKNGLETCTNAASRTKSISGKRYRVTEYSHSTDLDTQL